MHNGIIENFRELREELQKQGAKFGTETDTEVVAHLVTDEMKKGQSPAEAVAGGAAAAARRVRARLPVRGRGRSADRRAQGLAARDRLRRGRDVSRLRRDRARAVHRHDQLSRRRRLGGGHAQRRRRSATRPARTVERAVHQVDRRRRSWSTRATIAISWRRKSTSSRKSSATRSRIISTWRPSACAAGKLPFDFAKIDRISISACGTAYYAGLVAKYWFERFARLPVEIDVASEFRYREAPLAPGRSCDLRVAIGRDRRHARDAALRQGAEAARPVGRQRADLDHRARERRRDADAGRAGDRRRLDQGVHLPARGAAPASRSRPAARAACCRRTTSASWCAR